MARLKCARTAGSTIIHCQSSSCEQNGIVVVTIPDSQEEHLRLSYEKCCNAHSVRIMI